MRFQCQGKETPAVHAALPLGLPPTVVCSSLVARDLLSVPLHLWFASILQTQFCSELRGCCPGPAFSRVPPWPEVCYGPRLCPPAALPHWLQPVGHFPRRGCAELTDLWFTIFTGNEKTSSHYFFKYFYALKGSKTTSGTFCDCCMARLHELSLPITAFSCETELTAGHPRVSRVTCCCSHFQTFAW